MRTALLIADLEGIAGVDSLEQLAFGGQHHADACALMTGEVNAAIEGLVAQGFTQVRVSDSHRSGSGAPNLSPTQLHDAGELHYVDPDYYGGRLLEGVEAVACVGMHAAGATRGFAAHTVHVHTAWLLDGRPISETEIAFWLAADLGLPAIFSAGDDVLKKSATPLAPFVTTKKSTSVGATRSRAKVLPQLRAAAQLKPVRVKKAPAGPLTVRFKTEEQAQAAGASSGFEVVLGGATFTERYLAALQAIAPTERLLAREVQGFPGMKMFAASAARLLLQPFPTVRNPLRKHKA